MRLEAARWEDLDATTVYAMCRLRQQVFVVEQECAYPDLDGRDLEPNTRHVLMWGVDGALIGYARVLDETGDEATWRVGRVVLTSPARGQGLGEALMKSAVEACMGRDVVLDAQAPLVAWYETFGFKVAGGEFLEDGIAHVPMRLRHPGESTIA